MSLLNYFEPKSKGKGKSKEKKGETSESQSGSKRKLSNDESTESKEFEADFDEPLAKKARISSKSKSEKTDNKTDKTKPKSPKKDNKTKTKTISNSNSNDNEEEEEEEDNDIDNTKNSTKSKKLTKNSKNNNDEEEEEDDDVANDTKTMKSKEKEKDKDKDKTKDNNNSDSKEESVENTMEDDDNAEWEKMKANVDIKNLKFSNCDELLHPSWKKQLKNEFNKPYYLKLRKKLADDEKAGDEIFPPVHEVFRAFELCPWNNLKVVLLGQDPYHDNGQAEGLCFSVKKGIKLPSSLKNMYKELNTDLGITVPKHGSLVDWGKQGVLLLNTALTVKAHKANSHAKYGWQEFTDSVIKKISHSHDGVVFILWGKQAQKKKTLIDCNKHRIVESAHPSGLSASRGFYGSKPYSKTNKLLKELGKTPIDWTIT